MTDTEQHPRAYDAVGFDGTGGSGRPFVAVSPRFNCHLDDPRDASNTLAHVGTSFFMTPTEARLLAADLIKAADTAEHVGVKESE